MNGEIMLEEIARTVVLHVEDDCVKLILHANSNFSTVPNHILSVKRRDNEKSTEFLLRALKDLLGKYECNVWR